MQHYRIQEEYTVTYLGGVMCGCGQLNEVLVNHLNCAITTNQISHGIETKHSTFTWQPVLRISLVL